MEIKSTCLSVVGFSANEVVFGVPRHIGVIEVVAPAWESGRPEVHHEDLWLVEELDIRGVLSSAYDFVVDGPLHVGWSPLDSKRVVASAWLVRVDIRLVLLLPLPDNVGAEGVFFNGGNKLDIDFVPAFLRPVGTSPVGEEGADCAFFARAHHPDSESAVCEGFVGLDLATDVVG